MKNLKILACFLILSAAALAAVSCGSENGGTISDNSGTVSVTDRTTETESPFVPDELPELDYSGADFRILVGDVHGGGTYPTFYSEGEDGDIVNDAVWQRNEAVSERLNLKLDWDCVFFEYGTKADWVTRVTTAVMSGEDLDLICAPGYYTTNLVTDGLFLDMADLPYLDFSKPWWSEMYLENITINNKLYFALGDFSLNKLKLAYVMYFNKQLFADADMEFPYQTVLDGKWTLDCLETIIKDTYSDLNGDSKKDENDRYGIFADSINHLWAFMDPCGVKLFDKNAAGEMQFVMDRTHNADVVERLSKFWNENENTYHNDVQKNEIFKQGTTYLVTGDIGAADKYRDLDFDYGILPYPKWEESDSYTTRTSSAISVFCIPSSAKDPECTAVLLEAMNSETYRTLIPAYYETALKVKYARDDESVRVLDIVREGISMQFVDCFTTVFSGYSEIFRTQINNNSGKWSSETEKIREAALTKLRTLLDFYNS